MVILEDGRELFGVKQKADEDKSSIEGDNSGSG
jgi:hypothetical protein